MLCYKIWWSLSYIILARRKREKKRQFYEFAFFPYIFLTCTLEEFTSCGVSIYYSDNKKHSTTHWFSPMCFSFGNDYLVALYNNLGGSRLKRFSLFKFNALQARIRRSWEDVLLIFTCLEIDILHIKLFHVFIFVFFLFSPSSIFISISISSQQLLGWMALCTVHFSGNQTAVFIWKGKVLTIYWLGGGA